MLLLLSDTFHKALGHPQEGKESINVGCMDQTYSLEGNILEKDKVDNVRDVDLVKTSAVVDEDIFKEEASFIKTN